jgi:quinol monooxygenase YgiN/quercetin dioxygenase-like cupin family protein
VPAVARNVKMKARPGQGDALARLMLGVAASLDGTPGCELYVINRSVDDPDTVWVTERWMSQEVLHASLEKLRSEEGQAQLAEVMALLDSPPERVELEPLGGVGFLPGGRGATIVNLAELEDLAAKFGYGHIGEARFATAALGASRTGVSYQRLRPGARQAFGHRHHHAEEVFLVVAGGGRVKVDEELHDVRTLDAIRVAPESLRAFEAGPDGLDLVVVGVRHAGDAVMDRDFWPA